jgi:hypothetical protein
VVPPHNFISELYDLKESTELVCPYDHIICSL